MDGKTFLKEYFDNLKLVRFWFLTRTAGYNFHFNFHLQNKAQVKLEYIRETVEVPIETGKEGCLNLRDRYLAEVTAGNEVVYVVFAYGIDPELALKFFTDLERFQNLAGVRAMIFRGVAYSADHPKATLLLKAIEQNCEPEVSALFG